MELQKLRSQNNGSSEDINANEVDILVKGENKENEENGELIEAQQKNNEELEALKAKISILEKQADEKKLVPIT